MNSRPPAPLRQPLRTSSRAERGSALFLLLILAVVMASVLGGVFSYIAVNTKSEKRSNVRLESTYAAEYAFEKAYGQLGSLIAGNNLPDVVDTTGVTNLTTAPSDVFTAADGFTWKAFLTVPVQDGVPIGEFTDFSGTYSYLTVIEFDRTVPGTTTPVHMQFQREWEYRLTPLFRYAIFYNGDLELFPGAAFNVSGRVHSNARIYTGTQASITFSDYVTHVNGLSNHYMPSDPRTEPSLNGPITYSLQQPLSTSRLSPPGALNADTSDTNYNNDGPHELIEIPNSWQQDANAEDRMYNKAGLKILVNSTGSAVTTSSGVAIGSNSRVFLTSDGTVIPSTDPLATVIGGFVSSGSFRDYREGVALTTVDVDVSVLEAAYDGGGLPQTIPNTTKWPNNSSVPAALKNQNIPAELRGKSLWNGVLYVADVTNATGARKGVKITSGANLPDGSNANSPTKGLTIVTPNAAFLIGDYNTGGNPPVNSGSNLAANTYVSGYTVQPAAVIADAITVVSSSWTTGSYDSQAALSSRPATNTTINAAFISGIVATSSAAYSGGVENYIRLLENWSGRRLTYKGSMINVYQSQESTAIWRTTGNYYNAPTRNWYFNTDFLDPTKLPPGTPMLRSLSRAQWVQVE